MKRTACFLISIILLAGSTVYSVDSTSTDYRWKNMKIGGHGFITGIVMHPLEKDLMYIRTDVGGAYRWEKKSKSWTPLCDMLSYEESFLFGIDGIALDPNNPELVYMAAGGPSNDGYILKSQDRGKTWTKIKLTNARFDANGDYRGWGECISVDPNNSSVIYCGTANNGLYKSSDGALNWSKVSGVDTTRVRSVVFDKSTVSGNVTQTIYAGAVNKGVYKTTDGGQNWVFLNGSPKDPKRMDIGLPSGTLYAASGNGLFKYRGGVWSEISAKTWGEDSDLIGRNHTGIAVAPDNENILMCVVHTGNTMNMPILRSTDGGETWTNKLTSSTADLQGTIPWNTQTGANFSANTCDIKIDPHNSKRVLISDWFAVYITDDITVTKSQWTNPISGIEEVVPRDAFSPAQGKYPLITAIADVDGFAYEDIDEYPRMIRKVRQEGYEPWMMTCTKLDFCEEDPNIVVRTGVDWDTKGKVEISLDNTETWRNINNVRHYYSTENGEDWGAVQYGSVAVSAKKKSDTGNPSIVIVPAYALNEERRLKVGENPVPLVSFDLGKTWQETTGLPNDINLMNDFWNKHSPISSDRVNGNKFYIVTGKAEIYVSEDWGLSWTKTVSSGGLPNGGPTNSGGKDKILAVPNKADTVFVTTGWSNFLHYSTNGGKTFTRLGDVRECITFGFGKEAPGKTVPTMYMYGTVGWASKNYGIYRSLDLGSSWQKINSGTNVLGMDPMFITGDRREYGKVYFGAGGRGLFYGKIKDSLSGYVQLDENFLNGSGWQLTNMNISNNKLSRLGNGEGYAVYTNDVFSGNFKYMAKVDFTGSSPSNATELMFNYENDNNYYYVKFYNNKAALFNKKYGAPDALMGETSYSYAGKTVETTVTYEPNNNNPLITVSLDGTQILSVNNGDHTEGYVGVSTNDSIKITEVSVDNGIISYVGMKVYENGSAVTDLSTLKNKSADLKISLRSNSLSDVTAQMAVAVKNKNGAIESVFTPIKTVSSSTKELSIPLEFNEAISNDCTIEVYFWKSLENITPFVKKILY